jgi:hypothetical protein
MTQEDVFELVVRTFEKVGVHYMLCGSLGAMVYGRPRYTNDFDFVIAVAPSTLGEFHREFKGAGFYVPPIEVMLEEFRRHGQFNLLHEESGIKVDCMVIRNDAFGRTEFERKREMRVTARVEATVASPEDIIIGKLQYYQMGQSEKHLADIRGMIAVSGPEIDFEYIDRWTAELGLKDIWNKIRPSDPPRP